MAIIDIEYISTNSINMNLCDEVSNNTKWTEKLINSIEKKVLGYIDTSYFLQDNGSIIYPDDIKETVLYLVESYFVSYGTGGREFGIREKKSEKIDDYSYSKEYVREQGISPVYFYDIPITGHHLSILDKYKTNLNFGFGFFEI